MDDLNEQQAPTQEDHFQVENNESPEPSGMERAESDAGTTTETATDIGDYSVEQIEEWRKVAENVSEFNRANTQRAQELADQRRALERAQFFDEMMQQNPKLRAQVWSLIENQDQSVKEVNDPLNPELFEDDASQILAQSELGRALLAETKRLREMYGQTAQQVNTINQHTVQSQIREAFDKVARTFEKETGGAKLGDDLAPKVIELLKHNPNGDIDVILDYAVGYHNRKRANSAAEAGATAMPSTHSNSGSVAPQRGERKRYPITKDVQAWLARHPNKTAKDYYYYRDSYEMVD